MLFAGPGWVVTGCAKLAAGSFLTYLAVERGVDWGEAAQPATMFRIAYMEVFHNAPLASGLMLLFVVTCQIKINTTNAYAGSIAWSNFFSRLTHSHPGRVVWVVFNVVLALLLMELGIYQVIQNILGLYANFAVGWMGAMAADLVINKRLGLSPPGIEFKRAHLYDINPVGLGAMGLSVLVSTLMSFGLFGDVCARAGAVCGAVGCVYRGTGHRLGNGWQILSGAHAGGGGGAEMHCLRGRVRGAGYGVLPGLWRRDMLALLLAGCALP